MARLESVGFEPYRPNVIAARVHWSRVEAGKAISGLPQLFWTDGNPWREANLWLWDAASSRTTQLKTVVARATALHAYANWLEEARTNWWSFPVRESERCLNRYRGHLIHARDNFKLAPSTVTQRMRTTIQFYRWLSAAGLLSPDWPMWREKCVGVRLTDRFGFERSLGVRSTNLAIPNRLLPGDRLEDGLLPLSAAERDQLLLFARENASEELFLMLAVGFFTGMRLQTICDLKVESLTRCRCEPLFPDSLKIEVGPSADPPVATKFGVTGSIALPRVLHDRLMLYAFSNRRLKREHLASGENKRVLFLTRFGNRYADRGVDKSSSLNVEVSALRKNLVRAGATSLNTFRFHQTRATFATQLALSAIQAGGSLHALEIVRAALLHRNETTTLKYIDFAERSSLKAEAADSFTRAFLGLGAP